MTEEKVPQGILWIASYPKSGNTWTRAFLNNLLKILQGEDDGQPQRINRINEYTAWDISARRYERHLGKAPKEVTRAEIARIRPQVQAEIADQTEGLALVKTHHALVSDRGHPTLNFAVTCGAIYVVRNPLDVAVSFAHHLGTDVDHAIRDMNTRDLETTVTDESVYEVYGSWSQNVESWTRKPHPAIHVMRYEDMIDNPQGTFGDLARHLLLTPAPEQLNLAIQRSSFAELKKQEDEEGYKEKPDTARRFFRSGKVGEWKAALTRPQVRSIVEVHREQMRRFGYLTDDVLRLL